ncbi:hypothetical protein Nepgr_024010 [Nepenthes gracilis]|uniref:Uncharacterized protein n=1 Tax=Nepenthes gracilis TaxID=150966 RepID=A0AAD3XY80_NEPGR|nr:hypothetical protein Nepgr_024010 [Nepenthes gracilis]
MDEVQEEEKERERYISARKGRYARRLSSQQVGPNPSADTRLPTPKVVLVLGCLDKRLPLDEEMLMAESRLSEISMWSLVLTREGGSGLPFWMISTGSSFPKLEQVLLLAGLML